MTPKLSSRVSKPLRPPRPPDRRVVNTIPLSVKRRAGDPVGLDRCGEGVDDDWAGDAAVGGDRERVAGVVVDPAQDLGVGAVSEAVVGEVGLPGFVGLVGLEADVGRAWRFRGSGVMSWWRRRIR